MISRALAVELVRAVRSPRRAARTRASPAAIEERVVVGQLARSADVHRLRARAAGGGVARARAGHAPPRRWSARSPRTRRRRRRSGSGVARHTTSSATRRARVHTSRVGDRDRDDDPRGSSGAARVTGGQHRRARSPGRHRRGSRSGRPRRAAVGRRGRRARVARARAAPSRRSPRSSPPDAERLDDLSVEDAHTAGRDRAECELLVTGHAELAHEEHVERRVQGRRESNATGTPPRGSPSTTTSSRPAYSRNRSASRRPASVRSRKRLAVVVVAMLRTAPSTTPRQVLVDGGRARRTRDKQRGFTASIGSRDQCCRGCPCTARRHDTAP